MSTYWALFVMALLPDRHNRPSGWLLWGLIFLILLLAVGFRNEVGCDWSSYLQIFTRSSMDFDRALILIDPGYGAINWLANYLGGGYYLANLISAFFFVTGLLVFVRRQPLPGLALVIAVPYMIVVVAMGYTRQAVALGFLMIALTRLGHGRNFAFYFWVLLGALFHKTVIVMLPLGILGIVRSTPLTNWVAFALAGWWGSLLLMESYEGLWTNYVEAKMESQGALIRVVMNAVPAVVFLLFKRRWDEKYEDGYLWQWIAWASILCLPLLQVATTAVDRMALYFLPLQVIVFSRLPLLFQAEQQVQISRLIVAGYASVLFVWLNFAVHSKCWVPYENALVPMFQEWLVNPVTGD